MGMLKGASWGAIWLGWRLPLSVFCSCSPGRRPQGRPRIHWKDFTLIWPWVSPGGSERDILNTLLSMLPPRPVLVAQHHLHRLQTGQPHWLSRVMKQAYIPVGFHQAPSLPLPEQITAFLDDVQVSTGCTMMPHFSNNNPDAALSLSCVGLQ